MSFTTKMPENEIKTASTTITTSLDEYLDEEIKKYTNELTTNTSGLTTSNYTICDGVPYYYYNPFVTTTTSLLQNVQNEVENSNELKINIKKSQIKFNFNL